MKLEKTEIERIAGLACLKLSSEEVEKFQQQLSAVLEYMEVLNEVDTSQIEITAQVTGLEDVLRTDVIQDCPESQKRKIIEQFPFEQKDALEVPKIL